MKTVFSILAALVLISCQTNGGGGGTDLPSLPFPNVPKQELKVYHHSTTTLDNRHADDILAHASEVLQTNDGGGDVTCPVRLVRKGDVIEFDDGDGIISNENEFNELMKLRGIILVDAIKWCSGKTVARGCAPIGGKSMAVVLDSSKITGLVLAHEYGHNKGQHHCNDDKGCYADCSIDNALMHQCPGTDNRRINRAECNAFQR